MRKCKLCNYKTEQPTHHKDHLNSDKHKKEVENQILKLQFSTVTKTTIFYCY